MAQAAEARGGVQIRLPRREFLGDAAALAAAVCMPISHFCAGQPEHSAHRSDSTSTRITPSELTKSPFRIAVINDEISQDFGHACEVTSQEFGMGWIELRGMWNKNIVALDAKEIAEARHILDEYHLRVTDIASPLFKVDWPGAPKSKFSPKRDQFNADYTFDQQGEVLERSIEVAKQFGVDRIRCFDFWRLEDASPYRAAMNEKLRDAAATVSKQGMVLVLENEAACNTATAAEAAKVLAAVRSPAFMLNWDPGNAAAAGEKPYPDGYNLLPKDRIGHCHCKDAAKKPDGKDYEWAAMGKGLIDWTGQFAALKRDGYRFAVSLETHWRGAGTPEESSRQSWAGMKTELGAAGCL
jgi:L-ribulose-5-phosphate 3-epimerase